MDGDGGNEVKWEATKGKIRSKGEREGRLMASEKIET